MSAVKGAGGPWTLTSGMCRIQVPVVALDIAHKLLVEDQVVVCKMNPVNAWAGPFIRCPLLPPLPTWEL